MYNMPQRNTFLTVRMLPSVHRKFRIKAERYGGVAEVIREMVDAFLEDRLVIHPPVTSKKESLYVARTEDR